MAAVGLASPISISPQCGFATCVLGNTPSDEDEERKLNVLVETAERVWG